MLYASLNFGIYVTDFDPASYRQESTMVLFRNKTPVPLFLFHVRTAQQALGLPIWLFWGQICNFGLFLNSFGFFYFWKLSDFLTLFLDTEC